MKKNEETTDEIVFEICQNPEKAAQCTCWKEFDGAQWALLLKSHPQLSRMADKHSAWPKLDNFDWHNLICEQPDFMEAYLKYKTEDMTAEHWLQILKAHPQFLDICPAASSVENEQGGMDVFSFGDWLELLIAQPQLEDRVPWDKEKIGDDDDEFIKGWLKLIAVHHHFAQRLDWNRAVKCLDGEVWKDLLTAHREYEKYCPWDKLPAMEWWPLFKYCPQYFEKCRCPQDVPARAWAYLLCRRPELSERFFRWSQLTVNEWASLLREQPQLSNECPCIDKVGELPDDEFDTDGLLFPIGHEAMDVIVDLDFRQRRMEHTFERLQSKWARIEQTFQDKLKGE